MRTSCSGYTHTRSDLCRKLLALIFLLACCCTQTAVAQCTLTLRDVKKVNFSGTLSYDIYAETETAQTVFFSVRRKKNDPPCSFFVGFSRGQAGSYDRVMTGPSVSALHYQLHPDPTEAVVLKDIPDAFAYEVIAGAFTAPGETLQLSYYAAIPPGQILADGTYEDSVLLTLYEGDLNSYIQRDSASVVISTDITQTVEICIIDCGAPFDPFSKMKTMNFGELQEGAVRELDLLVRGSVDYEVSFSSENRGVLANPLDKNSSVPYVMTLNGAPLDLGSNTTVGATGLGPTVAQGERYLLRATIGSLTSVVAGDYSDSVTITVRSQ